MDAPTLSALILVVQDRDLAQRQADDRTRHSRDRETAQAEVTAYNMVLATFAGAFGMTARMDLELELRRLAKIDATVTVPVAPDEGQRQIELAREQRWSPDLELDPELAVHQAHVQAELDTQDAAMGNWEPRS